MIKEGDLVRVIGGSDGKSKINDIGTVLKVTTKMVKFSLLRCDVIATKAKKNVTVVPVEDVEGARETALLEREDYDVERHGDTLLIGDLEGTDKEELKAVLEREFGTVKEMQYLSITYQAFLVTFAAPESAGLAVKAKVVTIAGKACKMALAGKLNLPPQVANNANGSKASSRESNASFKSVPFQPNGPPSVPKRSLFTFMEENERAEANKRRRFG
jgi:hypothetical protein